MRSSKARQSKPCPIRSIRGVLISNTLAVKPVGGINHRVRDERPVRCQTYGYLPSSGASPPFDQYQTILLGKQRHMCVSNLPKIVTQQCRDSESILRPFGHPPHSLALQHQVTQAEHSVNNPRIRERWNITLHPQQNRIIKCYCKWSSCVLLWLNEKKASK